MISASSIVNAYTSNHAADRIFERRVADSHKSLKYVQSLTQRAYERGMRCDDPALSSYERKVLQSRNVPGEDRVPDIEAVLYAGDVYIFEKTGILVTAYPLGKQHIKPAKGNRFSNTSCRCSHFIDRLDEDYGFEEVIC